MMKKAIALLSGGLASSLAVNMMLAQKIEVLAVHFTSPFCNCTPRKAGCRNQAQKIAAEFGIPIQVLHKGLDYVKMVQNPPHGYGRAMNPCIDCRIYMLRKTREFMPLANASFIVTGEVLGQRPMSQHRKALQLIEKESELEGLILRPLSAHHFPPTVAEIKGFVDRQKLLSISGRSRRCQIDLAKKADIQDYPCPAGGCLLTDRVVSSRLLDLFSHVQDYDIQDLHLLKIGRHFRLNPGLKIVLGRNQEENEKIEGFAKAGSVFFLPQGFRGPTAIVVGTLKPSAENLIGEIMARYSQEEKSIYQVRKMVGGGLPRAFSVKKKFPSEKLNLFSIVDHDPKSLS